MAHYVLIVDDNVDELLITERIISRAGCGVNTFTRAETALESLTKGENLPALIFLDLKLPGMSGIDALRVIRGHAQLKNIPVVIFSNSTLESDRRDALNAGANEFLHKAFELGQFTKDIKFLLNCWLKN